MPRKERQVKPVWLVTFNNGASVRVRAFTQEEAMKAVDCNLAKPVLCTLDTKNLWLFER